ncbi:hypothetical protein SAMN05421872_102216 [Nocardioides lianchengensis]|uniref:DUF4157 domain-containing protein n=1 Tax=Nocardioides lianchengensis TaxID=1045774 RepID=A0A1G6LG73_9ACTN|nr:hypothetical protein SAMN05421872_102216 [Nocardioides lianchengensis]
MGMVSTREQRRRAARGSRQALLVTVLALAWARLWRRPVRFDETAGIFVAVGVPLGAVRAGTSYAGVYLARREPDAAMLRHEAVHAEQWARHGLSFPFRYWLEELRHRGSRNRFEIEAGLEDGDYAG